MNNYDIIEAIERVDKKMAIGFQFHPEKAIIKNNSKNTDKYMDNDIALKIFSYFIKNNDKIND